MRRITRNPEIEFLPVCLAVRKKPAASNLAVIAEVLTFSLLQSPLSPYFLGIGDECSI